MKTWECWWPCRALQCRLRVGEVVPLSADSDNTLVATRLRQTNYYITKTIRSCECRVMHTCCTSLAAGFGTVVAFCWSATAMSEVESSNLKWETYENEICKPLNFSFLQNKWRWLITTSHKTGMRMFCNAYLRRARASRSWCMCCCSTVLLNGSGVSRRQLLPLKFLTS